MLWRRSTCAPASIWAQLSQELLTTRDAGAPHHRGGARATRAGIGAQKRQLRNSSGAQEKRGEQQHHTKLTPQHSGGTPQQQRNPRPPTAVGHKGAVTQKRAAEHARGTGTPRRAQKKRARKTAPKIDHARTLRTKPRPEIGIAAGRPPLLCSSTVRSERPGRAEIRHAKAFSRNSPRASARGGSAHKGAREKRPSIRARPTPAHRSMSQNHAPGPNTHRPGRQGRARKINFIGKSSAKP